MRSFILFLTSVTLLAMLQSCGMIAKLHGGSAKKKSNDIVKPTTEGNDSGSEPSKKVVIEKSYFDSNDLKFIEKYCQHLIFENLSLEANSKTKKYIVVPAVEFQTKKDLTGFKLSEITQKNKTVAMQIDYEFSLNGGGDSKNKNLEMIGEKYPEFETISDLSFEKGEIEIMFDEMYLLDIFLPSTISKDYRSFNASEKERFSGLQYLYENPSASKNLKVHYNGRFKKDEIDYDLDSTLPIEDWVIDRSVIDLDSM